MESYLIKTFTSLTVFCLSGLTPKWPKNGPFQVQKGAISRISGISTDLRPCEDIWGPNLTSEMTSEMTSFWGPNLTPKMTLKWSILDVGTSRFGDTPPKRVGHQIWGSGPTPQMVHFGPQKGQIWGTPKWHPPQISCGLCTRSWPWTDPEWPQIWSQKGPKRGYPQMVQYGPNWCNGLVIWDHKQTNSIVANHLWRCHKRSKRSISEMTLFGSKMRPFSGPFLAPFWSQNEVTFWPRLFTKCPKAALGRLAQISIGGLTQRPFLGGAYSGTLHGRI